MERFSPRVNTRPEAKIQKAIVEMLRIKGWYCKETHGNMYQSGFPDIYATSKRYGQRWIEVKLPGFKGSKWTAAQQECYPQFIAFGTGIWILTSATKEQYELLFKACNYWQYVELFKNTRRT